MRASSWNIVSHTRSCSPERMRSRSATAGFWLHQNEAWGWRFRLVEPQTSRETAQHDAESVIPCPPQSLSERQGLSIHVARIGDHVARWTCTHAPQQGCQEISGASGRHRSGAGTIDGLAATQSIEYLVSSLGVAQ